MTLRSPIFRKLLWSAFLLIAATLVVLDFYLTRYMAQRQRENVEQRLAAQARLLTYEAAGVPRPILEPWARDAGARAETRVTVIDPAGMVLADSQHDPETMENHASRPEIQAAHRGGQGAAIRHSATLGRDLCYLAMTFAYDGKPGHILRLAVPLEDVDAAIAAVRWRILGASLAAALVALIVAYFFSRSMTRRISRLRAFAEGLVDARISGGLVADAEDELGALARSLDRMATQLRELVDRLSLESARREAILASMVEGVLAVDNELRVTFCNQSFARVVGVSGEIPQRLPLLELVRDPELLDMLTHVLVSGQSIKRRLELASAVGRTFEVQAAPLSASSHRGAIAILYDITDLERLERVRKDFVANVSHELRTPLTAIRGYAETLLEGALEDQENNRRFLEIIKAHAIRLNNIASDLLILSELESGKPPAEPERVSVRGALETAFHTVESEAKLRGVAVHGDKLEDAEVTGDKVRLEQALINLLDNAVKFNRPGGEVHVDVVRVGDDQVRIAVTDSGIGIPSEDLSRIFERFYRVDKARSREMGGTGLGLSIVKHVVERMGGSVTAESQLGRGSTFTVLLPRA
ncbi:MAG: PAS domain-containing protein [Acidobacteriia bacterium]|nr:PAS domain-containing protein [Terriglobia bacterium]